jgi:phosphatidate cytidylyltransferase
VLTRLLTAAALLPVVAAVYLGPPWLFLVLAIAAGVGVTWEALALFEARGWRPLRWCALASVVLLNVSFHDPDHLPVAAALAAGVALACGALLVVREDLAEALPALGATLGAALLPGFLLAFQVALRGVERERVAWSAPALLVFMYAAVFGADAAAYFVGLAIGRLRLAPCVSPNKTVEGLLGGVLGGIGVALPFALALLPDLGVLRAASWAASLALAGAFGDLTVSLMKRSAGVKDSGTLLPGHGGLLDRLASLLFASPLLYLLILATPGAGPPPSSAGHAESGRG